MRSLQEDNGPLADTEADSLEIFFFQNLRREDGVVEMEKREVGNVL